MTGPAAAASPHAGARHPHSPSPPAPALLATAAYPTARRASAPTGRPAIMVALSGWPEPVYVASDPSARWGPRSRAATPPQVYDGIGGPPVLPPALKQGGSARSANSTNPAPPSGVLASSAASPAAPGPAYASAAPSSTAPSPPTLAATTKAPSPYARPPARSGGTTAANATTVAFTPTPNTTPAAGPEPLAPNCSIFSTTCLHLADPSLGPCPFPTHPHDIRGMFPTTSHLAKSPPRGTRLAGGGWGGVRMPIGQGTASGSAAKAHPFAPPSLPAAPTTPAAPPRTLAEAEQQHRELTAEKGKSLAPATDDGPARPSFTHTAAKYSAPAPTLGRSYPPALPSHARHSAFQDPRYKPTASIFHKGRALPVVPSWSSPTPSAPSTPIVEDAALPSFRMADAEMADAEMASAEMEDAEMEDSESKVEERAKERQRERQRERKGFVGVMRATPEVYPPPSPAATPRGHAATGKAQGAHADLPKVMDPDMALVRQRAGGRYER